jgi:hypothetical protein
MLGKTGQIPYCEARDSGYLRCMDWQQVSALTIVAAAAGLLLWRRFRQRRFSLARDTHCGCAASAMPASSNSIIFRARKNGRSEVLVRMK